MSTKQMRLIPILPAALLLAAAVHGQTNNVAVNNDGAPPHPNAILDVQSNYTVGTQRGLLTPRLSRAQMLAIAGPSNGLTVYQTDNSGADARGFYYYNAALGQWVRLSPGSPWILGGNGGTAPATDFLGTINAEGLRMRANNVEHMVVDNQGRVGIGVPAPVERLDIAGAIRLTGTSATNSAGTIRWNGAPNNYHEGNIDGTPAGWRKLQNDYTEVENADYLQAGTVTCANGDVALGNWTGGTSNLTNVTPFGNVLANQYARHQYLFRASELNLSQLQLFVDPNLTEGLCAGPITKIAFWAVTTPGANPRNWFWVIRLSNTSLDQLSGFVNDPPDVCACQHNAGGGDCATTTFSAYPQMADGWTEFNLSTPFVWDGSSNILIDIARIGLTSPLGNSSVNYNVRTTNTGFNSTYGRAGGNLAACNANPGPLNSCTNMQAAGMTDLCGTGGVSQLRPVVRFTGVRGTAPPAANAQANYIQYTGGVLVEENPGWAAQTIPYYSFKGPGTVSAESGVWDNNSRLNDHVFDRYFDGRVHPADAEAHGQKRHLAIPEMVAHTAERRHLPTMKGRADWQHEGSFGLGDLTNQLWTTTETQALYLTELHERTRVLELLRGSGPIPAQELPKVRAAICGMPELTEAQKDRLLRDATSRTNTHANRR